VTSHNHDSDIGITNYPEAINDVTDTEPPSSEMTVSRIVTCPDSDSDTGKTTYPEVNNDVTDTEPPSSQMSSSPLFDHREALLPPFWGWFETTNPPYVACLENEQSGGIVIQRKRIVLEGNTLKYYVKDRVPVCSLPSHISTSNELAEVIQKFHAAALCEGCVSAELVTIKTSSAWQGDGILRSKKCTIICDKTVCCQCKLMIKNLKKKAKRVDRTCVLNKLKRSKQVARNAFLKIERRQSTIEVKFTIVLYSCYSIFNDSI
jgi:hypothetical protein